MTAGSFVDLGTVGFRVLGSLDSELEQKIIKLKKTKDELDNLL